MHMQEVQPYEGDTTNVPAMRTWIGARTLPSVPLLDAATGNELLGPNARRLVVLLIADPADPTTADYL
jgi:hypothetical protein